MNAPYAILDGYVFLKGFAEVANGIHTRVPPRIMVRFAFCVLQKQMESRCKMIANA